MMMMMMINVACDVKMWVGSKRFNRDICHLLDQLHIINDVIKKTKMLCKDSNV
jgi:hypothetical protein